MRSLNSIVFIMLFSVVLCGCSAQYHLRKALKKDPSIIDTTFTIGALPSIRIEIADSAKQIIKNRYVKDIERILEPYPINEPDNELLAQVVDSLIAELERHIRIKDTLYAELPGGGWVKTWQEGNQIKQKIKNPVIKYKVEPTIWQQIKNTLPLILIAFAILAIITIFLIRSIKK